MLWPNSTSFSCGCRWCPYLRAFYFRRVSAEAELVDEDDLYACAFGVEFLYGGVEDRLAAGEVGPALAVRDRPVIAGFISNISQLRLAGPRW